MEKTQINRNEKNSIKYSVCPDTELEEWSKTCQMYVPPHLPFSSSKKELNIPNEFKARNSVINQDSLKSTYQIGYPLKHWEANREYFGIPKESNKVQYLSTLDRKFFRCPPKPFKTVLSETKSKYTVKTNPQQHFRRELCPSKDSSCALKDLGKDFQPFYPPEDSNFVKYLDPYLTTNREHHYPFTLTQWNGIAKKNSLTIYDLIDPPIAKCKGFGVKTPPTLSSFYPNNKEPMQDRIPFKHTTKLTQIPRKDKIILRQGKITETMDQYKPPANSPLYTKSLKTIDYHMNPPPADLNFLEISNLKRIYNTESQFYGSNHSTVTILEPNAKKSVGRK